LDKQKTEIEKIKELIALESDETLDNKLHNLHQRKFLPDSILNLQYREELDELIALISKEKRRREKNQAEQR
jgi:hypothetical protein